MCGISGIINQDRLKVSKTEIERINELISHRGPDGEGYFFEKNFSFGHRRLSIIDLSQRGAQPMHFLDRLTITFNGEIYNYIEIKNELLKKGYSFDSKTDTEVILAAYDYWGEKCVEHFNGMWAFALYDKQKQIIFCSRDRFGIKPFYYTSVNGKFIFGSEIKQLLSFYKTKYANRKILLDYLLMGYEEHTNETFFNGVFKLEASHNLIYDLKSNTFKKNQYFELDSNQKLENLSEEKLVISLSNVLKDSINLRLRSDVRVGTCLSGGLDSAVIASLASKKYGESNSNKFLAIHAKSVEKKTDESHYAKIVSKKKDLDLHVVEPSLNEINGLMEEVIYTQEEPFGGPSIFMQYVVMQKSKNIGCKVLLDGQGGDEMFLGYERYHAFYMGGLLRKFKLKRFFLHLMRLKCFKYSKLKLTLVSLLTFFPSLFLLLTKRRATRHIKLKVKYATAHLNRLINFSSMEYIQKHEIKYNNLPQLLKYEDKNSMKNSVEARLPFLDYRLVRNCISIKSSLKLKQGYLKYMLRRIVESKLPNEIAWRTNKFGFEAPTDLWMKANHSHMILAIEKSPIINSLFTLKKRFSNNKNFLWRLYNVSVWEKVYHVKIEP